MQQKKCPVPPILIMAVGVIAVSFSAIFIKWSNAPASILGMYRLFFTVVIMSPLLIPRMQEIRRLSRKDWGILTVSGLFLGLHFLFWIGSLKFTTVASSMILTTLEPIFVMVGAYVLFKERTNVLALVSMLIAMGGTVCIAWGDFGGTGHALKGDMYSIIGTIAVSVYMLAGQNLRNRMSSFVYNILVFFVASIVFAVYNIFAGYSFVQYPGKEWGIFVLLAIVPTIFGHALFNWLLKYVNATTISMSILGEPVGAIALSVLLLNDTVTPSQWIGGCMAILGVWLFLRTNQGSHQQTPAASLDHVIHPNS
ncbi:DMT family transporter [Fodinisporobacter ferrooxydans]|uniref:DMT family transporter n=1 Tax=Fodinisporobacter ferrooxydans TaxID=2901836 RepID=A0ABY4CNQ2_9BACL|nr:DMT family transporter [Alicyclobacillaceae bacterium MYW30-H2]